jgi:hypothetical protein
MKYILAISAILIINLTQNYSQLKDSNSLVYCGTDIIPLYIYEGSSLIGPVLGYSIKSKVVSYGINFEYAFVQNKTGIFTIGIAGKFNTNTEDILDNSARLKTTNITFGLQSNFNLNCLSSQSLIPFAGVLLGYNNSVTKYTFNNNFSNPLFPDTKKHMVYLFGQAGVRYFLSKYTAILLKIGSGNIDKSTLELGIDFKL